MDDKLQRRARKESLNNECCSYDDYLQNLRLYFLEQLEVGKDGEKTPEQVVKSTMRRPPADDDVFFGKNHSFVDIINLDELSAEDKNIISMENVNTYSNIITPLIKKLPEEDKKLLNAKFGLYEDYPIKRNYQMDIYERARMFKHTPKTVALLTEKAIRKLKCILNEKPDIKTLLADTLLKDTEPI